MVFYTFAAQEHSASTYFSEAAKSPSLDTTPDNAFEWMLPQPLVGPSSRLQGSILSGPGSRHSMLRNMVGSDVHPYTGAGVSVSYNASGIPYISSPQPAGENYLNFVDSPAARGGLQTRTTPAPDVDYTYPDINNMFLAYKGWAIRDDSEDLNGDDTFQPGTEDRNGDGLFDFDGNDDGFLDISGNPRWVQIPVIVPSFFRPQYLKSATANGRPLVGNPTVPTDANWANAFDGFDRTTAPYGRRSFRPHPSHIAGFRSDGTTPVYRFITDSEVAATGVARAFPFIPEDAATSSGNDPAVAGELGIWTGSDPTVYELDVDNDGDGIREGIWLDLAYPLQQTNEATPRSYVLLHSVTVYDLDSLINLNVHGNLAGIERGPTIAQLTSNTHSNSLEFKSATQSNLGLGPNEINPIWALRRDSTPSPKALSRAQYESQFTATDAIQFLNNAGDVPDTDVEQANIELLWLLSGRLNYAADGSISNLESGRYGDDQWVYNAIHTIGGDSGGFVLGDLPRSGRSGNSYEVTSSGPRFGGSYSTGGRNGFDDNQDRFEGEVNTDVGRIRPFGQPMDYSGAGRSTTSTITGYDISTRQFITSGNAISPDLYQQATPVGPSRWTRYNGYSLVRDIVSANRYMFGINKTSDNGTGDDLLANPFFDALFEDPLETVFDIDFDVRPFDNIFGPQDLFELQLDTSLTSSSVDTVGSRMSSLSPFALSAASNPSFTSDAVRDRFTTYGFTTRYGAIKHPFGADGAPGLANVDDDGDGTVDELDEVLTGNDPTDDATRWWEFSADSNGADNNNDGYGDGNGRFEFPPAFGTVRPYQQSSPFAGTQVNDPFRQQFRRMITVEAGAISALSGQLPISVNHIIDVDRNEQTPAEGSVQFLQYMQRSGLRLRPLTEHPDASEANVLSSTTIPTLATLTALPVYPPVTVADREFWARRDRQQMARDIFVLLYTVGGSQLDASNPTRIADYTGSNADTGTRPLYTDAQVRRMAQFAVNMVDAMDTDNVMTKFEYDKNLGDGWGLDDDPMTSTDTASSASATDPTAGNLYPEDAGDRGVVYGVEAQQLAFSEVLAVRSPDFAASGAPESPLTQHTDDHGDSTNLQDTFFLHVELQNMLPTTVPLATSVTGTSLEDQGIWRISRFDRTAAATNQALNPTQTMTLMDGNPDVVGGDVFTITAVGRKGATSSSDPSGWGVSDLYVDADATVPGDAFNLISPDIDTVAPIMATPSVPQADLDLTFSTHSTRHIISSVASKTGVDFLDTIVPYRGNTAFRFPDKGAMSLGFELTLQRRANPNLPLLPLSENPWVDVDRLPVKFKDLFTFSTDPMTGNPTAVLELASINSIERAEPLANEILDVDSDGQYTAAADTTPDPNRRNTIGSPTNSRTAQNGGAFQFVQPHYDRDFASVGELLNLPLLGPSLFTQGFAAMHRSPYQQVSNNGGTINDANIVGAAAMFLRPDIDVETLSNNVALSSVDNRWYRLLQFVEVPSRVHRMFGNYLNLTRLPGKMNLNMFRHMEVYAGLIDDPMFADIADANRDNSPFLDGDVGGALLRDRWLEYLQERDGRPLTSYDPTGVAGRRNVILPGTPNGRPFRSLAYTANNPNDNGLEHTILRRLAADRDEDGDGNEDEAGQDEIRDNRNWIEVGATTAHRTVMSVPQRHQILSKIINNSTSVSNTFIVYATAGYFEAVETPTEGLIRVGGRIDLDNPGDNGDVTTDTGEDHTSGWETKAAFVIDRSEFLNAYDAGTGSFDWNRLVKARFDIK